MCSLKYTRKATLPAKAHLAPTAHDIRKILTSSSNKPGDVTLPKHWEPNVPGDIDHPSIINAICRNPVKCIACRGLTFLAQLHSCIAPSSWFKIDLLGDPCPAHHEPAYQACSAGTPLSPKNPTDQPCSLPYYATP